MTRITVSGWVAASLLLMAPRAWAQEAPVSRLLPEVLTIAATVGRGETGDHREHFLTGLASVPAIYEINRAVLFQAAAYPYGPTSLVVTTGATATDPRLVGAGFNGTAISMGSTKLLLGISYQSTTFSKQDDIDLRDSGMVLYIPHGSQTGDESDRDLLQQFVSIRLNRKVATISVSRAWGGRFDAGILVPVVQMANDVRVLTHVVRTASAQTPALHEFNVIDGGSRVNARFCAEGIDDPTDRIECRGRSTARGIGDLVVWGKATLLDGPGAVAFTVEARLPTGNADELIGLGATQVKPGVVWSLDRGRIGARARAEYTWSSGKLTSLLAQDLPEHRSRGAGRACRRVRDRCRHVPAHDSGVRCVRAPDRRSSRVLTGGDYHPGPRPGQSVSVFYRHRQSHPRRRTRRPPVDRDGRRPVRCRWRRDARRYGGDPGIRERLAAEAPRGLLAREAVLTWRLRKRVNPITTTRRRFSGRAPRPR